MAGNSVEVLENGAFFDVLIERIRGAEKSVHFETFLWKEGVLGQRVWPTRLSERARAGKQVRVLLDADRLQERRQGSRAADARGRLPGRVLPQAVVAQHLGVLNDRDHRKLVVIDGREAFVGGHCIVDEWLGDAEDGKHYRRRQRAAARPDRAQRAGAPSARTGPARPASCSSATTCSPRWSRRATC